MCLAQRHNAVTPVRREPVAPPSGVKHSITALPQVFLHKGPYRGTDRSAHYQSFNKLEKMILFKALPSILSFSTSLMNSIIIEQKC